MARPIKDIDPEQIKRLAAIQCSYAEMAAVLGCDESTLTRRYAQVIKEGRETGRMSLKRKQYEVAMALKEKVKAVPIASLIKLAKGA